jgi:farnesyl-diphosphate farnesyltransferase
MTDSADVVSSIPDDDLAWCHETLQGVSRTFALSIDVFDEPMSTYTCVGYLLCRIADTIEDSDEIATADKAALLNQYDRVLAPDTDDDVADFAAAVAAHLPAERSDDWTVVANADRVVRTFRQFPPDVQDAIVPPTRELVQGMAQFMERYEDAPGVRIQTIEELEEYCYYVAGTVGLLTTNLLTLGRDTDRDDLREHAVGFGKLLQLVNIAKDVHDDYTNENNVYLPADWLAERGVPPDEVLAPEHEDDVVAVVEQTVERARTYLPDAQTYLEEMPREGKSFAACAIPYLLAVGTLRELAERPEGALTDQGVKVSREEVYAVVEAATSENAAQSLSELRESIWHGQEPA